jgi:Zn-dependent M28 family amino/carboxypeptidase
LDFSTVVRLAIPIAFTLLTSAQPIQFAPVSEEVVHARLSSFSTKNSEREQTIRRLFVDAGCTEESLSTVHVDHVKESDLICTMPGQTDQRIVVGAHFDMVEKGSGVVDNWSGASLLSSLYQGLAVTPRKHTFVFISFSGEEKGLLGSKEYVRQLRKATSNIRAMVNMDTLGLTDTEVWVSHADPKLVGLMNGVANSMNLPVSGMNVDKVGSSDSESFRDAHIPAITIHSLTQQTLDLLHSPKDQLKEIHFDAYYRTYKLVLAYLAVLDQKWD